MDYPKRSNTASDLFNMMKAVGDLDTHIELNKALPPIPSGVFPGQLKHVNEIQDETANVMAQLEQFRIGKLRVDGKTKDYSNDGDTIEESVQQGDVHQGKSTIPDISPETARKCQLVDYYFLDHYFDLLSYLHQRKMRAQEFKDHAAARQLPAEQQNREWKKLLQKESYYLRQRRSRTKISNFTFISQIGQGGYGEVYLVRKSDTEEVCALKKMNKIRLSKMNEIQHILTERDVLTQSRSPWLTKLLYAFQDVDSVYLAMEYVPGGDMRTLLNKSGILLEKDAQFYIAEMFMGVNELHRLGYLHRDLKPENFLIDVNGHLKLTDFGLSKGHLNPARLDLLKQKLIAAKEARLTKFSSLEKSSFGRTRSGQRDARAFSLVGSPDYMAPEVLQYSNHNGKGGLYAAGYDYLVDYWSLGCILFEMLAGYPPFAGPSMEDVWVNLYHWQEVLEMPFYEGEDQEFNMSEQAWKLITSLITHRHQRIQSIEHVCAHSWFHDMNSKINRFLMHSISRPPHASIPWSQLRTVSHTVLRPPFIPTVSSEDDTSNFDDFSDPKSSNIYKEVYDRQQRIQDEIDREGEASNSQKRREMRIPFLGFSYRHKDAVAWNKVNQIVTDAATSNENISNPRQYFRALYK